MILKPSMKIIRNISFCVFLISSLSFSLFPSVVYGQNPYENPTSNNKVTTTKGGLKIRSSTSAFVSSISPSIASSYHSPAPFDIHNLRTVAIASQYKVFQSSSSSPSTRPTILFSSTKSSSSSSPSKHHTNNNGKIQVKLLKDIPGIGQAGDFIQTASTYFENKLRPTKSAIRVSLEDMNFELNQRKQIEEEKYKHALQMKEKISSLQPLEIKMKSGPDGHLFGGVGYKLILEEIKKKFPTGALEGKHVKIMDIVWMLDDGEQQQALLTKIDGKKETTTMTPGHDIKHVGKYKVTLSLMKDLYADFYLHIKSL